MTADRLENQINCLTALRWMHECDRRHTDHATVTRVATGGIIAFVVSSEFSFSAKNVYLYHNNTKVW